jgi:hypothetical protein
VFVFACFVVVLHAFERFRMVELVLIACFDRVVLFCARAFNACLFVFCV